MFNMRLNGVIVFKAVNQSIYPHDKKMCVVFIPAMALSALGLGPLPPCQEKTHKSEVRAQGKYVAILGPGVTQDLDLL